MEESIPLTSLEARDTYITLYKLRQVNIPDLERNGISEQFDATLVNFEAFLKILVFLEESSIVNDDLSIRDSQLENLVVNCLRRLNRSY